MNKKGHGWSSKTDGYVFVEIPVFIPDFTPKPDQDYGDLTIGEFYNEFQTCTFFGCGKKLTMTEKLYGDTCFKHNGKKENIFHNGVL